MAKKKQLPKHVYLKGRIGKSLWFEKRGFPTYKFKTQDPEHPDFYAEYAAVMRGDMQQRLLDEPKGNKRTFKKLIASYVKSPRYKKLAKSTLKQYNMALNEIERVLGNVDPNSVRRKHVIQMQSELSDRPRHADYCVQIIRILLEHALDLGWVENNHAKGVKLIGKTRDNRLPWPPAMVEDFRKAAGSNELLLFELLLGTGQRIGDVLDMQWHEIVEGGVWVVQNKTGKRLWIPFGQRLLTLLGNTPKRSMFIVNHPTKDEQWTYDGAQAAILKIRKQIGAEKYDIHSLRYTAASEMALAGCDDSEIAAVTGQTLEMVKHYTAAVRQKVQATRAIAARERIDLRLAES